MAAVAARSSHNSPHLTSRMSSPKEPKRSTPIKNNEDGKPLLSSLDNTQSARQSSPPQADAQAQLPKVEGENETNGSNTAAPGNTATATATSNAQPLAPPPRPTATNANDAPDYFSTNHNTSHYGIEPNPFETSFANPSAETPGKGLLPPVASLTSPSSLLPGGTPGWANSLRSGPLSPAMLTGPASAADYFDPHFRNSFPTPNESSLRTGLTPGGGGSMFPAPSPNSQALFNQLQSGGATPGTLDFRQTAMNAAAASKQSNFPATSNPTTQAEGAVSMPGADQKQYQTSAPQQDQQDPFGQHDTDAANGLYLLAQNGGRNANQFAVPNQPAHIQTNMQQMNHVGSQSQESSPLTKRAGKNSINSVNAGSGDNAELSESGNSEQAKPATRSRGKKGAAAKAGSKRKAEDSPAKGPATRRSKASISSAADLDEMDTDDEDAKLDHPDDKNKKMTDEEKRKNFLERNRVAALKCRQRKKQWLANLQAKVELFSTENDALSATVTQLREEIVNLKSLLLAHKECPVSQAQGLSGTNMHNFIESAGNFQPHNPYGMAMGGPNGIPPGMQMGIPPQPPPPGMQRS